MSKIDVSSRYGILFDQHDVLAVLAKKKTQVRVPLTRINTLCNGFGWRKPNFDRAIWDMAFVDPGPSPAGNSGPYLHVSWPQDGDYLGARVYPRFAVGDKLLVQEDWSTTAAMDGWTAARIEAACKEAGYRLPWAPVIFAADGAKRNWEPGIEAGSQRIGRHMPLWLSRLPLTITKVGIERLRDISVEDLRAEAAEWINPPVSGLGMTEGDLDELGSLLGFMARWDVRHAKPQYKWTANPWTIVLTFTLT